jgi:phosphoglycerate dehydrogenase-like enzyme
MTTRPKAAYVLAPDRFAIIYGPPEQADIARMVDLVSPLPLTPAQLGDADLLKDVRIILSGWGMTKATPELLGRLPNLQAVFYGAGTISGWVTPEFWARNIAVTTASAANAIPVAEFAAASILLCLKRVFHQAASVRAHRSFKRVPLNGAYKSTVGLISLGLIGQLTRQYLRHLDVHVVAYDPYFPKDRATELGVRLVSLEELFATSHVVSLHAPWTKATEGLITGKLLSSLPSGGAFINTARGAIVREPEMFEVLRQRPDLQAIIDVTHPEPPPPDSPYYTLPNILLTPHIAGSIDGECHRMGRYMVEELERFLTHQPLRYRLTKESLAGSAHEGV